MQPTVVAVFGVNPFKIGGVEIYTRELARQLEAKGAILVAVFTKKPTGIVADYLNRPNLRIEEIPTLEESEIKSVPALAAILRRHKPHVLHLQFVNFLGVFPLVAKMCGVKQVFFTAQGSEPAGVRPKEAPFWKRSIVGLVNGPIDRVFCISNFVLQNLVTRRLLPEDRFRVVFNAILPPSLASAPAQAKQFRAKYSIPHDCLLVTQVSWLIPEKGIRQLLEAARIVLAAMPETRFAIVGNGSDEGEYRRLAEQWGIAHAIVWTGMVQNPMEDGVYAATDVFCLASQWQEAFGWVIAEAMAFEKPVVATRVGGIPEVVEDGESGLLVSPTTNFELLAQQILRLLRSEEDRRRMGKAGRAAVEQKFHLEHTVAQVVSEYSL